MLHLLWFLHLLLAFDSVRGEQVGECAAMAAKDTSLMSLRAELLTTRGRSEGISAEELTRVANATLPTNATAKAALHANATAHYEEQLAGSENATRCKECATAEEKLNMALRAARQAHVSAQQLAIALAKAAEDHEAAAEGYTRHYNVYAELQRDMEQLPPYNSSKSDFEELVKQAQELYAIAQNVQSAEQQQEHNRTLVENAQSAYDEAASSAQLADQLVEGRQAAKEQACASLAPAPGYRFLRFEVPESSLPVKHRHTCIRELYFYSEADGNGELLTESLTRDDDCEKNGGKLPCASASLGNGEGEMVDIFDRKESNYWCTTNKNGGWGWFHYHFAEPVVPKSFKIVKYKAGYDHWPRGPWYIKGSSDGEQWDILYSERTDMKGPKIVTKNVAVAPPA